MFIELLELFFDLSGNGRCGALREFVRLLANRVCLKHSLGAAADGASEFALKIENLLKIARHRLEHEGPS